MNIIIKNDCNSKTKTENDNYQVSRYAKDIEEM